MNRFVNGTESTTPLARRLAYTNGQGMRLSERTLLRRYLAQKSLARHRVNHDVRAWARSVERSWAETHTSNQSDA
jgi:hypothetical protein